MKVSSILFFLTAALTVSALPQPQDDAAAADATPAVKSRPSGVRGPPRGGFKGKGGPHTHTGTWSRPPGPRRTGDGPGGPRRDRGDRSRGPRKGPKPTPAPAAAAEEPAEEKPAEEKPAEEAAEEPAAEEPAAEEAAADEE